MKYTRFIPNNTPCGRTRREFLWQAGGGFAGLALIDLLSRDGFFAAKSAAAGENAPAAEGRYPLAPKTPHYPATARSVIFLFMEGGPSHMDLFDPKPKLNELAGQPLPPSFGRVITSMGEANAPLLASSTSSAVVAAPRPITSAPSPRPSPARSRGKFRPCRRVSGSPDSNPSR